MTKKQTAKKKQKDTSTKKIANLNDSKIFQNKWLGLILGGSYFLIMAIISFSFHKIGDYGVETDFFWSYVPQAQNFLDGNIIIDKYRGPLYPITLGLFSIILGDFFKTGIFLAILSASLIIYLTYELLKSLFNPLVALITVLLLAVNTTFNLYTYSAGTDMFFNFLITASLFFILKSRKYELKNIIIAAVFGGLAYITRYNGIFIFITVIASILFINIYKLDWKKRSITALIFIVVFAAIISPWGIYTQQKKGKAFFNQNYQNIAYEYLAKDKMSWDEFWYQGNRDKYSSLTQVVFQEPGTFFKQLITNSFSHLGKDLGSLIGWHIAIFSIFGLLLLFIHPPDKSRWTFYLANFLFFGVLLLVFYNERFSMFLIPFYLVFGVNALFSENKYLKKSVIKSQSTVIVLATILIIWNFSKSYSYNSENISCGDKNLPKMAKQFQGLKPKDKDGDKIMARKAHIAYYLNLEKKYVPTAKNYYEQVALLWKKEVDYVYYSIWEAGRGFNFLQDPSKVPPDFKLLTYTTASNKLIRKKEGSKSPYDIKVQEQTQPALLYKVKIDSVRYTIIDCAKWFEKNIPIKNKKESKQEKIMAVAPYLAYYLGRTAVEIPKGGADELLNQLKKEKVDYLYFGLIEASARMQLGALLNPDNAPQWLEVVAKINMDGNYPAVLYKVVY
ncbi:MAG: glycosyltransferase family 39 protein [Bacteroidota bacterium]|nr:glycosyltransferase family 39 protein [Bacteroidota bacterium]